MCSQRNVFVELCVLFEDPILHAIARSGRTLISQDKKSSRVRLHYRQNHSGL